MLFLQKQLQIYNIYKITSITRMSEQIQMRQFGNNQQYKKMDTLFYNSIQKAKKSIVIRIFIHLFKLIMLCVFLPIDVKVLATTQIIIIAFMGVSIAIVGFNLLIALGFYLYAYKNNKNNNIFFIRLANKMRHSVPVEGYITQNSLNQLQLCVSNSLYNVDTGASNDNQGLTQEIRSRYQSIYTTIITHQVTKQKYCFDFLQSKGKLGSLSLVIFGIVALSLSQPNPAQLGVLIPFIVFEALYIWFILLILLIISLSPLIVCVICCWGCFCAQPNGVVKVPNSIEVTNQIIQRTDGSCPICFQAFIPKQKVVILACSDKHVFHEACLSHWLKIGHTCPMCRKQIGQN